MNPVKTFLVAAALAFVALPVLAEDTAPPVPAGGAPGFMAMKPHKGMGLEKLDTDKDGNISKAEFLADAEKHFNDLDANQDGMISKEEIEARRAAWQQKMKENQATPPPADNAEPPKQ